MMRIPSLHRGFQRCYSSAASRPASYWCANVVYVDHVAPGSVTVEDGIITKCSPGQTARQAQQLGYTLLSQDACLSPGLIDVHTHISALGRDWEGYATATKAAAAGGITCLLNMPLNSQPACTTVAAVQAEQEAAEQVSLYCNVGLWGGIVPDNCNEADLTALLSSGVFGLKAFLSPLPPAAGFASVSPTQLLQAAKICGRFQKPILVHAELMTEHDLETALKQAYADSGVTSYRAHVASRPAKWEQDAVSVVCEAAKYCPMHIVHLSNAMGCLPLIAETKQRGNLTVETCPHYLLLDDSKISDGNVLLKCFPPIREFENRDELWRGMREGLIDMVASDHSPCEPSLRCLDTGNFQQAWGGLSGLQYQLQATWTEAAARGSTATDMATWWSRNPAALARLSATKGSLEPGKDADLCLWDTDHVGAPNSYSREYHRWKDTTYYADRKDMRGRVLGTWVGGVQVYDGLRDEHLEPAGRFLLSQ